MASSTPVPGPGTRVMAARRSTSPAASSSLVGSSRTMRAINPSWAKISAERVQSGRHAGAAVVEGGVGERQPHGEVLLGLDVGVAVVLVPRYSAGLLGLLVDGLVPVEVDVGTDQVGAQVGERR